MRFLDHLAFQGNARAAAMRVGVSHETVYRARRRDAAFAALWDAALVHARKYSEQVLTTRALDGIEVEIWHRGELVGHTVRHDTRLLLAHQARLDRQVESNHDAVARAARFDELLAQYAGHEVPESFEEAVLEARVGRPDVAPFDVPPTRDEYCARASGLAMDAAEDIPDADEEALEQAFMENAGQEWDDWQQAAFATLDAVLEGGSDEDEDGDPSPLAPEGGAGARDEEKERNPSPLPQAGGDGAAKPETQRQEHPEDPLPPNLVTGVNPAPPTESERARWKPASQYPISAASLA